MFNKMIELLLKYIQAGAFFPLILLQIYLPQERHSEFEPDKAHSTVVGIICPLVEIGLTVTQHYINDMVGFQSGLKKIDFSWTY